MTPKPKSKRKPKAKSAKSKGGQPGNKNALRHGFYSKGFTSDQKKRLDDQIVADVEPEINLLRVCIDDLKEELSFVEVTRTDNNGTQYRDGHYLQQLNTLAIMTQSLSGLVRTHYLTKGKGEDILTTIEQAWEEIRLEMGI